MVERRLMEIAELEAKSRWVRRTVFEMIVNANKGHPGGSLSCVDIMVALFYEIMKPEDVFILSKGNAAATLYAILADKGIIPMKELMTYNIPGSRLEGHPHIGIPGVFCNSGSLGNGLGIACGVAMARPNIKVYVLMGDGECEEGSVEEARQFMFNHDLPIVAIVDHNLWKATGKTTEQYEDVDGHSLKELVYTLRGAGVPDWIVAKTTKGKGVSYMENTWEWHNKAPKGEQIEIARRELVY
jgi:transketolase